MIKLSQSPWPLASGLYQNALIYYPLRTNLKCAVGGLSDLQEPGGSNYSTEFDATGYKATYVSGTPSASIHSLTAIPGPTDRSLGRKITVAMKIRADVMDDQLDYLLGGAHMTVKFGTHPNNSVLQALAIELPGPTYENGVMAGVYDEDGDLHIPDSSLKSSATLGTAMRNGTEVRLAMTFDFDEGKARVYLNGTKISSTGADETIAPSAGDYMPLGTTFTIVGERLLQFGVRDVALWNRELTADEIAQL